MIKIAVIAFILLVPACVYEVSRYDVICVQEKTVQSVGGCNREGTCGVQFSDGSTGRYYLPAPGQIVCVNAKIVRK